MDSDFKNTSNFSDNSDFEYEEESEGEEDSNIIISSTLEETQKNIINNEMITAKNNYMKRLGIYEFTGMICERFNQLERAAHPLVDSIEAGDNNYSLILKEIRNKKFPIIIEKGDKTMSIYDFNKSNLEEHLKNTEEIWRDFQKKII